MKPSYWSGIAEARWSRRRALSAVAGTGIVAALLAACGGEGKTPTETTPTLVSKPVDETKQAKRGGTLKSFLANEPPTLDPNSANSPGYLIKNIAYSLL